MKHPASLFLCLPAFLLALLVSATAEGEARWTEVRSPHFRVVTDGSGADGRRVANEFELIRYVIGYRFAAVRLDSDSPMLIMAVLDRGSAERLQPAIAKLDGRIAGDFIESWARNYAMVRLDEWDQGAQATVFHEYTHSILHLNTRWMPTWLDEGMAEFFAYTRLADGKVYVGGPTLRSRVLRDGRFLPVGTILSMKPGDYQRDDLKTQQFYAEAWGLVHYLTFGPGMGNGGKLALYFKNIQMAGVDARAAFREIFGDPKAIDAPFQAYVGRFLLPAGVVPLPPAQDPKSFAQRQLPPAEADYLLGAFHLGTGDVATGRSLLEKAIALDPKLGGPHEEMGFLLYDEGKDSEARAEWAEANALDPALYRARFAEVMTGKSFREQTDGEQAQTLTELRAVAHTNPRFAPAYMEIALLDWQRGDLDGALRASQQGEELEPWRAGYRVITGRILLAEGKGREAAEVARTVAAQWPGTDGDEAIELWKDIPAEERGGGEAPTMELAAGVQMMRGTVESLQCAEKATGRKMQMEVHPDGSAEGTVVRLTAGERVHFGFMDTLWRGERSFSACHHMSGGRVVVAYRPEGTGAGEFVWFDVTESFPSDLAAKTSVAGVKASD